jgi:hypothetical protein
MNAAAQHPPDEVPRPPITATCRVCRLVAMEVAHGNLIVAPDGMAHRGEGNGDTTCGMDATGPGWWWPL